MDEQLAQSIVNDLARHRSRNEVIRAVCEQAGLNWPDAERLVEQVEHEYSSTLARRESPLMLFLSAGTFLIGVALLIYGAEFFMAFFQGDTVEQVLSLRSAYLRIAGSITGLGMTVGGLIGLWSTVAKLWNG